MLIASLMEICYENSLQVRFTSNRVFLPEKYRVYAIHPEWKTLPKGKEKH